MLEQDTMAQIVSVNSDILELETNVLSAMHHVQYVQDLKPINVKLAQMFLWFYKKDIVLEQLHVTLDSSLMKPTLNLAKNVLITVLFVMIFSNVNNVLLDMKHKFSKSVDKQFMLVPKFVAMELNMKQNAMMEIKFQEMVALVNAISNLDGLV